MCQLTSAARLRHFHSLTSAPPDCGPYGQRRGVPFPPYWASSSRLLCHGADGWARHCAYVHFSTPFPYLGWTFTAASSGLPLCHRRYAPESFGTTGAGCRLSTDVSCEGCGHRRCGARGGRVLENWISLLACVLPQTRSRWTSHLCLPCGKPLSPLRPAR